MKAPVNRWSTTEREAADRRRREIRWLSENVMVGDNVINDAYFALHGKRINAYNSISDLGGRRPRHWMSQADRIALGKWLAGFVHPPTYSAMPVPPYFPVAFVAQWLVDVGMFSRSDACRSVGINKSALAASRIQAPSRSVRLGSVGDLDRLFPDASMKEQGR